MAEPYPIRRARPAACISANTPSFRPAPGGHALPRNPIPGDSMRNGSRKTEVVVVTGATSGIGRAVACAFAAEGSAVALLGRSPEGLDGATRDVESSGARALAIPPHAPAPRAPG